jgi:hypothetical protein
MREVFLLKLLRKLKSFSLFLSNVYSYFEGPSQGPVIHILTLAASLYLQKKFKHLILRSCKSEVTKNMLGPDRRGKTINFCPLIFVKAQIL